jgi:protein-tyrosine phosphatase
MSENHRSRRSFKRTIGGAAALGVGAVLAARYSRERKIARARPYTDPDSLIRQPPRDFDGFIPLEGAINFRDIGGYQTEDGKHVRRGMIYRSGALGKLTESDMQTLREIGIRRVFDMRLPEEVAALPDRIPQGAAYISTPITAGSSAIRRVVELMSNIDKLDKFMLRGYTEIMLDHEGQTFGTIYRELAKSDGLPAIIHCTAGKDRTGMAIAILLSALGVADEAITADYSLSNRYFPIFHEQTAQQLAPLKRLDIRAEDLQPILLSDPLVMQATLDYLRSKYGTAATYLKDRAGIDAATLEVLKDKLLA